MTDKTVSAEQAREASDKIERALSSSADDALDALETIDAFIAQHSAPQPAEGREGFRLLERKEPLRMGDEQSGAYTDYAWRPIDADRVGTPNTYAAVRRRCTFTDAEGG